MHCLKQGMQIILADITHIPDKLARQHTHMSLYTESGGAVESTVGPTAASMPIDIVVPPE